MIRHLGFDSLPPNLYTNVYFWRKQRSTSSQINIVNIDSHQTTILHMDRASWNCDRTRLIHIACTTFSAMATEQENFLPSAAFLFSEDSENVENTCKLARLGKIWNEFNYFQTCKTDIWNKMRTAIEIKGIEVLINEREEIKVWKGTK